MPLVRISLVKGKPEVYRRRVGEFVGADKGLGYLLLVTNSNLETALMFATLFALTIIGLAFFYAVELLEALLIPWHVTHRVREDAATL